ncbi:hypothetical protein M427DRAFT_248241 [Gonapodya prolifera JEL478]|uniref:Uncharacterized protein n=1 Tax=Gonapodya prolifera (strain JEL478) TaxID=1344416 RepID=A0A138ZXN5_GONPJ|nr:hypothetical protein M427DRAFT_248241 [Gonapodya prolifera JEL478]|eukprot:KXS09211.1 hypothetical protein M427DRAFT_248241 [Gonapodya prolifera JEL478]
MNFMSSICNKREMFIGKQIVSSCTSHISMRNEVDGAIDNDDILDVLRTTNEARFLQRLREDKREIDDFLRLEEEALRTDAEFDINKTLDDAEARSRYARKSSGKASKGEQMKEEAGESSGVLSVATNKGTSDNDADAGELWEREDSSDLAPQTAHGPRFPSAQGLKDTQNDWNHRTEKPSPRPEEVEALLNELVTEVSLRA